MARDPELLAFLRRVLEQDPSDVTARLQLAGALLDGEPATALAEAQRVLATHPTDELALRLASGAARRAGQAEVAAGYQRVLDALGQDADGRAVPLRAGTTRNTEPDDESDDGVDDQPDDGLDDEFDRFLREVVAHDARGRITLADVGGLEEVKRQLETSFLAPMRNASLRRAFRSTLRGGLLLYGPPGCGKTFLARAVAGELGAHFLSVGLHDVLDMWLGNSEKNVHATFEKARRLAPCVLFLDEVDALGQKRSHLAHSAGRNVVVQLLSELDSIDADNDDLFVLGATNAPWDLDPALRRPGRFDRMLLVLPPDRAARVAILGYHLRDRPQDAELDLESLADVTEGWSGADLALVVDTATDAALADSVDAGEIVPVTHAHLDAARRRARPSTRPWFDIARSHAVFADTGDYDELLAWMRAHDLA